tara:strand:- start:4529 stop:5221 length:693 start_codon:yes stop_codon:yes gene_type:complete
MYKDETKEVTFNLKEEHIYLLSQCYVNWQDCESGAPEINPKRPYGNSNVDSDLRAMILDKFGYMADDGTLWKLHTDTEDALQIILSTGSFETGLYSKKDKYANKWEKVVAPEQTTSCVPNIDVGLLTSPVYISGPITGIEDGNKAEFDKMAEYLRSFGFSVINPRRNPIPDGVSMGDENFWNVMMKESLKIMMRCNSMVQLKGWMGSTGSIIEVRLARDLHFDTIVEEQE